MFIYIGLDLSITNTGISIFNEDGELLRATEVSSTDTSVPDIERFRNTAKKVYQTIKTKVVAGSELFILYEDYAFNSPGQKTRLAENAAIIKHMLYVKLNVPAENFMSCSVNTLKKFAAGKNAGQGKGPVMVGCMKKWDFETKSDDVADAYVLGRMARELHYWKIHKEPRPELLVYEKECVETVRKKNGFKKR